MAGQFITVAMFIMVALVIMNQDTMHPYIIIGTTGFILTTGTGKIKYLNQKPPPQPGAFNLIMTGSIARHFNNYGIETFQFSYHVIKRFTIHRIIL